MGDIPLNYTYLTDSGIVTKAPCVLAAILVVTDGANVPSITGYDGQSSAGSECIPTGSPAVADRVWRGFTGLPVKCIDGAYLLIDLNGGTIEVVAYWRPLGLKPY